MQIGYSKPHHTQTGWQPILLLLCAAPFVNAQTWTVPETSSPIQIELQGTVEFSRASVQTIRSGSPNGIVSWIGPDGKHAGFGDELMRFDTSELQRQYQDKLAMLTVQQKSRDTRLLALRKTLAVEEEDLATRLANLAVRSAETRAAAKPDASEIATLKKEIDLARREAALQEKELARKKRLLDIGELPRIELEDAELALEAAKRQVRIAELQLEEAGDGSDPVLARRAAWLEERTRTTIGVDPEGNPLKNRGYGRKIEALRQKLKRAEETLQQEIEAGEIELQGLAFAAWPHVPLKELRISSEQGVVRTLQVSDEDPTALYDPERGFGWTTPPTVFPSDVALVIQGPAQWRCDLPPGAYKLEVDLADKAEWYCMSVKSRGKPLVAENHLIPGQPKTVKAEVQVGQDGLRLDFGLPYKAILASQAGAVKNQNWMHLGYPIRNNPPALYLTPDAQAVIRLRVHHLQAPFFQETPAANRRIELRNSRGEWVTAGKAIINEDPVPFFPAPSSHYGNQPEESPEERTAREVTVSVPREHGAEFAFAAQPTCRLTATPNEGVFAIPAFLVKVGEDGLFVQRGARPTPVKGIRYDQHFLITEGLRPGDALSLPKRSSTLAGANRVTGEVISGSAVPIVVPTRSWARIEDLIPHGSEVKKGDLVVTLYRPKENERSIRADAKATGAEANFLDLVDTQQLALLKETDAHARIVQEEKLAADRVAENRRLDQAVLASAVESERATEEELELLEARVNMLEGKESTRLDYEDYRRRRDILRLQMQNQRLNAISTFRKGEYTAQLQDRMMWRRARKELEIRETSLSLNLKEQEVMRQRALNLLEDNLEDRQIGRDFETRRFLKAPASGHVFYMKGYNDLARRRERLDKEFVVWNGLTIAEILDMANLSFRVSLPENQYHAIRQDMELPIELEDLDDRLLVGRVARKGRSLYEPNANRSNEDEAIGLTRVFDVTLTFSVPEDLRSRMRPGLRGAVTLP